MSETSSSRDNEIVVIKLSIRQSKLVARLIDADSMSTLNKKSLQTLTDLIMAATQETEAERQERYKKLGKRFKAG